ncbi:MAG TPA: hypothetical protein VN742_11765 [Candidatus Binataceae bacterium]|jgi:hypothetical protein|nr:hypothetical protein [Candidatus Binataceae bacterium]
MTVEGSKARAFTRRILVVTLVGMLGGLVASSAVADPAKATPAKAAAKRRLIPLTINKGQNYTISGVKDEPAPGIKVVHNPNALVLQTAPGRIEMVGADAGTWRIKTTLATGEKVTYVVTVKALAPPQGTLVPVGAPTAIP